jgi:hypothetical protein
MNLVCFVKLNVTVNYTNIMSVVNECLYGKFRSPATIKPTLVLTQNARCCIRTAYFSLYRDLIQTYNSGIQNIITRKPMRSISTSVSVSVITVAYRAEFVSYDAVNVVYHGLVSSFLP